tara:strand:+ start:666 stop:905 length:240 start_codon:yes stop_codon:yes gene_type:complete
MDVWDPKDKMAVFWEIKKLISALYRALKSRLVSLDPGKRPKNIKDKEWKRMTQFTEDMVWLFGTLFILCIIAWLTKDVI